MNRLDSLTYTLFLFICFSSCVSDPKSDSEDVMSENIYINKKIIFPNESWLFGADTSILIDSTYFSNDMIKLVHVINLNCSNCIDEHTSWKTFLTMIENDCQVIFWLDNVDGNREKINNLIYTSSTIHFISGYSQSFKQLNDLMYPDINLNTILLDQNNRIKLVGDPIIDKKLISVYSGTIASLNNNNDNNLNK